MQFAFARDSVSNTHPVSTTHGGPYFDSIIYAKGASLLRMLNYTIGASVMQSGLQLYLQQRQYNSANHEQLWAALTTVYFNCTGNIQMC